MLHRLYLHLSFAYTFLSIYKCKQHIGYFDIQHSHIKLTKESSRFEITELFLLHKSNTDLQTYKDFSAGI